MTIEVSLLLSGVSIAFAIFFGISTSKSNRRKARGEVQLYNTSKQKKEKTQEVADKLDHGVFKKSCGCLRAALHHH